MSLYQNHMVDGADGAVERIEQIAEHFDALAVKAKASLALQLHAALLNDPLAKTCYIPGVKWQCNAVEIIGDQLAGKNGEQVYAQMLTIIKLASESNLYPLNSIAQEWIKARVDEHAEYFCDDLVNEMKGNEE